ncbi:MAG: hypothetical protein ACJ74W_03470 [Pyrinomonadaceae bacterium]
MMEPKPVQAKPAARYRGLLVIWVMQFVTLIVFFALTRVIEVAARPNDEALRFQLFDVLGGASLALSFVVKRMLLRRAVITQRPDVTTTAYVIAFALCELAAIMGLVNYLISGVPIVLLFVLAAVGLLLHVPRRAHIEAATPGGPTQGFNSTLR